MNESLMATTSTRTVQMCLFGLATLTIAFCTRDQGIYARPWTEPGTMATTAPLDGLPLSTLIRAVKDDDIYVSLCAIKELAEMGPAARTAVPALIDALKDYRVEGDGYYVSGPRLPLSVSQEAAKALMTIDPEAAKKAGVR